MVHPCYLLILQTLLAILSFNGNEVLATENASVSVSASVDASSELDLRRWKRYITTGSEGRVKRDVTTTYRSTPMQPKLTTKTPIPKLNSTMTYRGTYDPTKGPASTGIDLDHAPTMHELSPAGKFFLTAFHVVNLSLTLLVNLRMIYLVTTKINILKRPAVIPLLATALFCLGHLFSNIGLLIGITYGDWLWSMTVCGSVEVVHRTVVYFTINACTLVTMEATWLLLNPLTYRRSSLKVFIIMVVGTVISFLVILPMILTSFTYIEVGAYDYYGETVSDLVLELYNFYGDINAEWYIPWIVGGQNTFTWLPFWKRCTRFAFKRTWDRRMTVYYPVAINIIAFALVIFSFAQILKPSRKNNNFQAALSGKGKFTLEDMANNEKLVKGAAMTTIVTCAPCFLTFLIHLTAEIDYNFDENMGKLWGKENYESFVNATEFIQYLIPWCSPLAAMIMSPAIVRARAGENDFGNTRIDRFMGIPGRMFGKLKRWILDCLPRRPRRRGAAGAKKSGTWTAKLSSICGKKNSTAASDQPGPSAPPGADTMV